MRKLLNTLYVTNPDVFLSKDHDTVVARKDDQVVMQIPAINLEGIVCFNRLGASPYLMEFCVQNHIGLCFLTPNGRFMARINGAVNGNVIVRRSQYRISDDEEASLAIARYMIAGKVFNSRKVLERFKRDYSEQKDTTQIEYASRQLAIFRRKILTAKNRASVRGLEGDSAVAYFMVFGQMILAQQNDFSFAGRNRRPPKDFVNCMLSFVYMLLAHEVESALETVGLDPYVGFLHTERPGRPALALDMMEEFRAFMCDRLVLSMINRCQITKKDFLDNGSENIILTDNGKKKIISCWQQRKKELLMHPFLKEKVPIGLLPYIQARLLARVIRGEIDKYPVFLIQ